MAGSGGGLIIGVTATREGGTAAQLKTLADLLSRVPVDELHHGDAVGGDADADRVACSLGIRRVSHPPDNPRKRAFTRAEEERPELPYLARNAEIVRETGVLIALPRTDREEQRSGTWSTVRTARRWGRSVAVIWPDGSVAWERLAGGLFREAGE